jgi:hypothetical protein
MFRPLLRTAALAAVCVIPAAAEDEKPSDLVVHEWGTFLAMSGSDGISLDGMYHEEHSLPPFVHARRKDQLRAHHILTKSETPVIYFHTDRAQQARIEVLFPRGVWTQWYPQAALVGPSFAESPKPGAIAPRNGRIVWHVEIVPAKSNKIEPPIPATATDALWSHARQVDSAFVRTHYNSNGKSVPETERFVFYRGLGAAPLPLQMSAKDNGTLAIDSAGPGVKHLFVLRVERGKGAYQYVPALNPGQTIRNVIPSLAKAMPSEQFSKALGDDLAARLVESGLTRKEALAMVNTWRSSYFGTDGIRTLFVLPQEWTDEYIPLKITPAPKQIVRVMVGRMELLTQEREQLAAAAIKDLASKDSARRLKAFEMLRAQGRYVEPVIRRVLASTRDQELQTLCRRLLLTGFVTDLRASVKQISTTKLSEMFVWNEDGLAMRARLAGLLRDVGLDDEAKAEGAAVAEVLKNQQEAPADSCAGRFGHMNWALALEGQGNHAAAAERYGRMIDLAAVAVRNNDCQKCHAPTGTLAVNKLPDWWAGEAYTRALRRANRLDAELASERQVKDTDSLPLGAQLKVAYIQQATGQNETAGKVWTKLEADAATKLTKRENGR